MTKKPKTFRKLVITRPHISFITADHQQPQTLNTNIETNKYSKKPTAVQSSRHTIKKITTAYTNLCMSIPKYRKKKLYYNSHCI